MAIAGILTVRQSKLEKHVFGIERGWEAARDGWR